MAESLKDMFAKRKCQRFENKTKYEKVNTHTHTRARTQNGCVQYGGPYGAIPLASSVLHAEVCHQQTVRNSVICVCDCVMCVSATDSLL